MILKVRFKKYDFKKHLPNWAHIVFGHILYSLESMQISVMQRIC